MEISRCQPHFLTPHFFISKISLALKSTNFTRYVISVIDKYRLPIAPLCNGVIPSMNFLFGIYQPNQPHYCFTKENVQNIFPNNNTVNFLSQIHIKSEVTSYYLTVSQVSKDNGVCKIALLMQYRLNCRQEAFYRLRWRMGMKQTIRN